MLTNKNPRQYEVQLWTLQDDFIAVLKSFNVDNFGTIQDPEMSLSDDSEDSFSFNLPMYIRQKGKYVENPVWYNVTEGNLIENLRKVKVIFYRGMPDQRIFEFVITKVTEKHDGFEKTCEVECEGLAFNELGKTGYNISLSQELYDQELEDGVKCIETLNPENGILHLATRTDFIYDATVTQKGGTRKYEVKAADISYDEDKYAVSVNLNQVFSRAASENAAQQNNNESQEGTTQEGSTSENSTNEGSTTENNTEGTDTSESTTTEESIITTPDDTVEYVITYTYSPINNINYWLDKVLPPRLNWDYRINMNWSDYPDEVRDHDKVYEDEYIENWEWKDNDEDYKLYPTNVVTSKEKFRIITQEKSNRYNITQSIAETFGVYCRYIYTYDDNLHIIGRTVEFYNNTLREDEEIVDFTYYYDTEDISRSMDSADQVTKMYVNSTNDNTQYSNSIITTEANKTLEDYIMNFDYMYETGAITDEQKEYIEEFESEIRKINLELAELSEKITICENTLNTFKAKKESAEDGMHAADEALDTEASYIRHLLKSDKIDYDKNPETLSATGLDPECVVCYTEDEKKYCDINREGVIPNTIKVFTTLQGANNYHRALYNEDIVKIEPATSNGVTTYKAIIKNGNGKILYNGVPIDGIIVSGVTKQVDFETEAQAREAAAAYISHKQNSYNAYLLDSKYYQVIIDEETGFATGLQINVDSVEYDNSTGTETGKIVTQNTDTLFLVYDYSPESYHRKLFEYFKNVKANNEKTFNDYTKAVEKIDGKRDENDDWVSDDHGMLGRYEDEYAAKLEEKENLIIDFENYLGPAVREGNWQPEDDYAKYGDNRQVTLELKGNSTFDGENTAIGWDEVRFEGEEKNYYRSGIDQDRRIYYPCIKLTSTLRKKIAEKIQNSIEKDEDGVETQTISINDIGFVWDDTAVPGINNLISDNKMTASEIAEMREAWEKQRDIVEKAPNDKSAKTELNKLWAEYVRATRGLVEPEYPQIYRIGSQAEIAFLMKKEIGSEVGTDTNVVPVLMLTDADSYCSSYKELYEKDMTQTDILKALNGKIGILTTEEVPLILNEETGEVETGSGTATEDQETGISYIIDVVSEDELQWIEDSDLGNYVRVYPRIQIPYSNFLETDNYNKIIIKDDTPLALQVDYTIAARYDIGKGEEITDLSYWLSDNELSDISYRYYITIKPEVIIRNNFSYGEYNFFYKLSNTALAIYIDALEVLKENSIPKVEYEITPMILKTSFMKNAYDRIHTIVHINDPELKFENVQGYISAMTLKLDEPQEDDFTVKNYTAKFEDLFSSIVASTEAIQKNSAVISSVSQSFSTRGTLTESALQESINQANLVFKMSNDDFIIDDTGIKAYSESGGIVKYTKNGIFTAEEKDDNGNWKWNTSIQPSGISANAITTGQLNTNLIRIYSGNDLRFQMNGDGLFAYKSWLTEPNVPKVDPEASSDDVSNEMAKQASEDIASRGGIDPAQYVVMNADGLFLTAKKGAFIIDDDDVSKTPVRINEDVNRVEVSWRGLVLRNNAGEETLYADPDTGNLNISGNIKINNKEKNISAELTENRLRFGPFELAQLNIDNSETLSFVYYSEGSE